MKSVKQHQELFSFDEEEKKILKMTGIPPVFAQFLKEKSLEFGIAFALRATSPLQRYLMPAAPKPLSVKIKTGNWGFTKGVISVDPLLGKVEKTHGKWHLIERHEDELPKTSGIVEKVLHRLSLQEVLAGLVSHEFQLINTTQDIYTSGELVVKATKIFPIHSNVLFRINLKENKNRIEHQCQIDFKKILISLPEKEPKPHWWNDQWGDFEECLNDYYPAQYKLGEEKEFRDIYVYGVRDETDKVLPITGDQDLLWISIPSNKHDDLLKDFEEVIDTSTIEGIEKLYRARVQLFIKLGGNPENAEQNISNDSIAGLGRVTAYESYVIDEINKAFANCGIRHLRNLIQHAAENHSTEHLSPLNTNIVHIWHGKINMTRNENEIIQFIMQSNYPKENIIDVNPKWDMAKWGVVVAMQIALNQPVPPDTLAAYRQYCKTHKKTTFFGLGRQIRGGDVNE